MDSENSSVKIEKLDNSNYHFWKIRIQHILTLKDLENYLDEEPPTSETSTPAEITKWRKLDKKAQAIIGLTLSDELLENVREVETAKAMWTAIKNVFERHTLLNKLSARKKFYTAAMNANESVLQFANRIRQLAATLKSMSVLISESEMAMALLNGLPDDYNALISALDAIDEDETKLKFEFIKSRIMQEEQRILMRTKSAQAKSEAAALLAAQSGTPTPPAPGNGRNLRRRPYCNYCNRLGHVESKCWTKFPHLNPNKKGSSSAKPALIATQNDEDPVICLMAKYDDSTVEKGTDKWFVDSGCSNHMTFNKSLFSTYTSGHPSSVELGNNNTAKVAGVGIVEIPILVNGKRVKCVLQNVLHVPDLGYQLLSVPTFDKSGFTTSFHSARCWISNGSKLLATATIKGNLYELDTPPPSVESALLAKSTQLWHQRLAHIQPATIIEMSKSQAVRGLEIDDSREQTMTCAGCALGKAHRAVIPKKSHTRSTKLLELVHSDVNGPLEVPSLGGSRYFVTFIDDFSRWTSLYTMKTKSETFSCFKKFHAYAEKHTGARIESLNVVKRSSKSAEELKALRTDNGGEYISLEFKSYLQEHGIQHQLTVAYTPQQNGVAERMNRTLLDCVRSLIHTAQLDKNFWAEALSTAVHIRNRVTSRSLPHNTTPYQRWMGKIPDLSYLRVFGCKCWFVIPKARVKKLDARSKEGLMMGYSNQSKGYKIWDIEASKLIISRDVTFDERSVESLAIDIPTSDATGSNVAVPGGDPKKEVEDNIDLTPSSSEATNSNAESDGEFVDAQNSPQQPLRRSARIRKPTGEWWKATSLLSKALVIQEVPISYKMATSPENVSFWQPGIDREHDSLLRNRTWDLVDYANGIKVLPCKYVFKIKENKPKVRLVALGCRQQHGIDYNETYAPVVTLTTVRTILAISAQLDLELEQMDVVTAFLNGDLEEDVYMAVPEGLTSHATKNKVCKLLKSLYGLKQSPRQWYAKIHDFLIRELRFESSSSDPCLYTRHNGSGILIIALYVDDLLIAGNSKSEIDAIKKELSDRFEMKDLGEAKVMLGIEIKRDRRNRQLFVSQSEYTQQVLERFGMSNSKHISTPMDRSYEELVNQDSPAAENIPYRQVIGSLMYLMIGSRPDLAFVIGKLSQHSESPNEFHWIALKRALRYVNSTRNYGILYDGSKSSDTVGFSDADWGGCRKSRKSTSGFVFLIAGGAVSWRSKKQTCVATSTCEAEYVAMCMAAKESIWLSRLIAVLRSTEALPIVLGIDNNGAIETAKNASVNQRNKHIDLQYHFVRQAYQENLIQMKHVNSDAQVADSLTKPLDRQLFSRLTAARGLCSTPF